MTTMENTEAPIIWKPIVQYFKAKIKKKGSASGGITELAIGCWDDAGMWEKMLPMPLFKKI